MMNNSSPYRTLPAEGPYAVGIGTALITMVEPDPGYEIDHNRWYEDDHFYVGAMANPWLFAGRRWVAPRQLQLLRYPESSAIAQPVTAGAIVSTYWITAGRQDDYYQWCVGTNLRLLADGRLYEHRRHIYTSFQTYVGAVYRDGETRPWDIHALDYPFGGLVMEVVDAPDATGRDALLSWLTADHLPPALGPGSPAAMALVFYPNPLSSDPDSEVQDVPGTDRRATVLWFCDEDPRVRWADHFAGLGAAVEGSGLGRLELCAGFIPTVPGTDRYMDQLR